MSVPRGTTPTITLTIDDETIDLTQATNVYVTFSRRGNIVTKTGTDLTIDENTIEVTLSQAETLAFSDGPVDVQANWTYAGGARCATEIAGLDLTRQLLERVIE